MILPVYSFYEDSIKAFITEKFYFSKKGQKSDLRFGSNITDLQYIW